MKIEARLQAILSRLVGAGAGEVENGVTVAQAIHSATAEEVIDFINSELRSS